MNTSGNQGRAFRAARLTVALAAALVVALAAAGPAASQERLVPESREQVLLFYAPVVARTAPAVVNICSRKVVRSRPISPLFNDPFFRRFFGAPLPFGRPRERVQNSLGSGVILGADGIIVTNHHVIAGADEITVGLADRREFGARLVGSDERTDLAVLRVDTGGEPLPFLSVRDSDDVAVGDLVLAIGNPFGVGQTVTSGIVSALARTQVGISDLNFFIQTDAAINPGNSGGALVDLSGRLIGVNTAIYSKSGGSLGIGFAVPSNMVRSVVAGLTGGGRVVRPWLGASGQAVTAEIAQSLGLDRPAGVLVNTVYPQGPASRAGLEVGDVVLEVDGRPVDDPGALSYRLATLPVGGSVELRIQRGDDEQTLRVPLMAAPEVPPRDTTTLDGRHPLAGATVANMSPALAEELGRQRFDPGVVVLDIRRGTPAARMSLRSGDRIEAVNGQPVQSVRGLGALLQRPAEGWRIGIRRGNRTLTVVVRG